MSAPAELDSVIGMLHERYPQFSYEDVAALVSETYQYLAEHARLTGHLVPLTQNHARHILAEESGK